MSADVRLTAKVLAMLAHLAPEDAIDTVQAVTATLRRASGSRSPGAARQQKYRDVTLALRHARRNDTVTSDVTGGGGGSASGSDLPSAPSPVSLSSSEQIRESGVHVTDGGGPPPANGARGLALVETFLDGVGGTYAYPSRHEREVIVPALWAHARERPLTEWRELSRALGRRWVEACRAAGQPGPLGWLKAKDWLGMGAPAVYSNGGPPPKYTPQALPPKAKRLWQPPPDDATGAAPTARTAPTPPTATEPHAHGTPRAAALDPTTATEPIRPAAAH